MLTLPLLTCTILFWGLFAAKTSGFVFHKELAAGASVFRLDWLDDIWEITGSFGFSDDGGGRDSAEHDVDHNGNRVRLRRCRRCRCGQANERNGRLLGGTDLVPFEYPWLVQVQTFGLATVPGTLINDRYVLTAASAMKNLTPYDVKAIVGMPDICVSDTTSTILSITTIALHPEYAERTRQNDIALLRLAVPLKFGPYVAPICLPKSSGRDVADARRYANHVSTVASWLKGRLLGQNNRTTLSDTSCLARKVGLPILDVTTCSESAARTQGCLGVIGAPSLLCRGDAGAGVAVRTRRRGTHVLLGVLSDQQYCESRRGDALVAWEQLQSFHGLSLPMYTRVAAHLGWIGRNTRDACYCGR